MDVTAWVEWMLLQISQASEFASRYSPKLADFVPSLWYGRKGAGQNIN